MNLAEAEQYYSNIGFAERVGFGEQPALLIIDCNHGCADPSISPIGIEMTDEIAQIRRLLDVSRDSEFPVVHTTVVYSEGQLRDGGWFVAKVPALAALKPDTKEVQIVPELAPNPGELVIEKCFPSGFSGTHLHAYLTRCRVDTVVVVGNSTSGCVRATVVDAVSAGFRVIVPRQCVADRVPLTHMVNLFDIDSKYGDVMDVDDVITALKQLAKPNSISGMTAMGQCNMT